MSHVQVSSPASPASKLSSTTTSTSAPGTTGSGNSLLLAKNKVWQREKKSMSKDVKGALKTKRKLANFIERAAKITLEDEQSRIRMMEKEEEEVIEIDGPDSSSGLEDEDEQDISIMSDEGSDTAALANNTINFSFNESAMSVDSDEVTEDAAVQLPHMRLFSDGISYRKLTGNSVLLQIEPFKRLYFAGKALVQVLSGSVNIYGFHFGANGKKYSVFSAKGHSSLVYIQSTSRRRVKEKRGDDNYKEFISDDEFYSAQGTLVVLEGFENEWCDGVRHSHPQGVNYIGPSITGIGPGNVPPPKHFFDKLGFQFVSSAKSEKIKLMEFPSYFDEIFTDLIHKYDCSTGKICPFGGKGVGKSTFVRWLTNRFLSYSDNDRVLFLDLDPGQTEYTPPGVLSVHVCTEPILGPNFSHLQEPARAVFLGGVNVSDFPVSYIKGVVELFEYCVSEEHLREIPLVINTMGFCRGLGVDFACEIIKIIRPDAVIQLNIDNEKRSFPFLLNRPNVSKHSTLLSHHIPAKYTQPLNDFTFLSVNSVCNRDSSNAGSWGAIPKVSRELMIISYFAEKIGSTEDFSLLSIVPLCVPLESVAIGCMNCDLSYEEILATMNGNLVALCEMTESGFESISGSNKKFIRKAENFPNKYLGYGIVRAIDKKSDLLYLVTPLQEAVVILKVNVILAAGPVGLPVQFYIPNNKDTDCSKLPYVMERNEGTSTLHSAAKKFFVPKRVVHPVLKNCLL